MRLDTVGKLFEFLYASPELLDDEELSIVWVAGEPLAVPVSFYEHVFDVQMRLAPSSSVIKNYFQTNGTLLNQAWCEFIKSSGWNIGVSLDGPRRFHDARRVDRLGRGTYDQVMHGIDLLQQNDIPFDIIAVLSSESLDYVKEHFDLYSSLKPGQIGLNYEEIVGANQFSSFCEPTVASRFTKFLFDFLELRDRYAPEMRMREIDPLLRGIMSWRRPFSWMDAVPLRILSVSWKGEVSTFSPELIGIANPTFSNFVFGNIFDDSLADLLKKPAFLLMQEKVESGIHLCQSTCDYFAVCGGGSPARKLSENGTFESTETMHCRLRVKAVGEAAINYLELRHGGADVRGASILQRIKWLLPRSSAQTSPVDVTPLQRRF